MTSRWGLIVVVFLAATLFACGGDEAADGGGDGGTTAGGDAGGDTTVASSAAQESKDAFTRIREAVANRDFRALYGMLSDGTRAQVDGWVAMVKKQIADLEAKAGPLAMAAKQALVAKFGADAMNLEEMSAEDAGAYAMGQLFGDEPPAVLKGEVKGEPVVDGNTATLTVEKADGTTDEVEMVKEDGTWGVVLDDVR